jgi:hypothetical protein
VAHFEASLKKFKEAWPNSRADIQESTSRPKSLALARRVASPAVILPAAPRTVTVESYSKTCDPPSQISPNISTVLGDRIEHTSLDWGGRFPGLHGFYRSHDRQNTYIVKPKFQLSQAGSSKRDSTTMLTPLRPKRRHLQAHVRDDSEELYVRASAASTRLTPMTGRGTAPPKSPCSEDEVTYVY